MRRLFFVCFSLLFSCILYSQSSAIIRDTSPAMDSGLVGESWPEVPHPSYNLDSFLVTNIKYPQVATDSIMAGTVYVSFFVEMDGSISNVTIKESTGNRRLDQEALRVVSLMPPWNPGKTKGKPMRIGIVLPIKYETPGR